MKMGKEKKMYEDIYMPLFSLMLNEYSLIMFEEEMQTVMEAVKKVNENLEKYLKETFK